MTDREMLELAAKAAKLEGYSNELGHGPIYRKHHTGLQDWVRWNPLIDDGDAFRLAVRLSLHIGIDAESAGAITVEWGFDAGGWPGKGVQEEAPIDGDDYAATRRAITRAAAEIALSALIDEAMKEAALREKKA